MNRKIPRFIVCSNPACQQVHQVRRPYEQAFRKFCSRKCAAIVTRNITKIPEANRRGGLEKARRARVALMARLHDLTPLAAFRLGYDRGLHSKHRQLRRRRPATAA